MILSKRIGFRVFQTVCYVISALVLFMSLKDISSVDWTMVLIATIAATYFDVRSLKLPSGEDLSTVASVLFVVGVTNGVLPILLVTLFMSVCMMIYHRETLSIILFNACQYTMSAGIATVCFRLCGGSIGASLQFSHIIPYLMFNVTYFICNVLLVTTYLRLKRGLTFHQLLGNLLEPQSVLIYFVTMCFGIFMTIIYQAQGFVGLIATSLLLAVLAYTFHRYYTLFDHFRSLSNRDELTGLHNHRYFQEKLDELLERKIPTALALVDLDYFKRFNDVYGHIKGDELLRDIAKLIESSVPCENWTCRYGGEEFGIILPHMTADEAVNVSEGIRSKLGEQSFFGVDNMPNQSITVSIGVSSYPAMATSKQELVQFADEALYTVKYTTRNRVELYSPSIQRPLRNHELPVATTSLSQ